jgi:hypothetical protein
LVMVKQERRLVGKIVVSKIVKIVRIMAATLKSMIKMSFKILSKPRLSMKSLKINSQIINLPTDVDLVASNGVQ